MSSADTTDKGRQRAALAPSPKLILICGGSPRAHSAWMVAACKAFEEKNVHRADKTPT